MGLPSASFRRLAQGPPRVHERENSRRHPVTHAPTEPVVLERFLYFLCPSGPGLYTAAHDSRIVRSVVRNPPGAIPVPEGTAVSRGRRNLSSRSPLCRAVVDTPLFQGQSGNGLRAARLIDLSQVHHGSTTQPTPGEARSTSKQPEFIAIDGCGHTSCGSHAGSGANHEPALVAAGGKTSSALQGAARSAPGHPPGGFSPGQLAGARRPDKRHCPSSSGTWRHSGMARSQTMTYISDGCSATVGPWRSRAAGLVLSTLATCAARMPAGWRCRPRRVSSTTPESRASVSTCPAWYHAPLPDSDESDLPDLRLPPGPCPPRAPQRRCPRTPARGPGEYRRWRRAAPRGTG
jgi:hypothetical protein